MPEEKQKKKNWWTGRNITLLVLGIVVGLFILLWVIRWFWRRYSSTAQEDFFRQKQMENLNKLNTMM